MVRLAGLWCSHCTARPGSRLKFSVTDGPARDLGLRVIAPDRWGYGGTDVHPAPTLAAYADDVGALADRLGIGRFAVLGVSGGGPYTAAVAAKFPDRVLAAALVAPVGPIAGEPDSEITRFHRFCFGAFATSHYPARVVFGAYRRIIRASPGLAMRVATARVGPKDRETLAAPGVLTRLADTFREGLREGAEGPGIDLDLFSRPWGVPLANVRAPACLWIGTDDRNVPISAARRLASRIAGCEIVILPEEGHFWIALHYGDVLDWIAQKTSGPG